MIISTTADRCFINLFILSLQFEYMILDSILLTQYSLNMEQDYAAFHLIGCPF